jgi:hypothetical protein
MARIKYKETFCSFYFKIHDEYQADDSQPKNKFFIHIGRHFFYFSLFMIECVRPNVAKDKGHNANSVA